MNKSRNLIVSAALVAGILATSVTAFAGTCPTTYSGKFCGPSASCPSTFSFSSAQNNTEANATFLPINVISSEELAQISTKAPKTSALGESVIPQENTTLEQTPELQENSNSCQSANCDNPEDCLNDCNTNCVGDDCQSTDGTCSTSNTSCGSLGIDCSKLEDCLNGCKTNCAGEDCQTADGSCSTYGPSCGSVGIDCSKLDDCLNGCQTNCEGEDCQTTDGSCSTYGPSCNSFDVSSFKNIDFSSLLNQGNCPSSNFGGFGSSCGSRR